MKKFTFIEKMTALFGAGIMGIVVCLIMTIVTAVQDSKPKLETAPHSIPTPALQ